MKLKDKLPQIASSLKLIETIFHSEIELYGFSFNDRFTIQLSAEEFEGIFTDYKIDSTKYYNKDYLKSSINGVEIIALRDKPKEDPFKVTNPNCDDISRAIQIIKTERRASVSHLQRKLRIGWNAASVIMDRLEEMGIVGPQIGSAKREIFIDENPPEFTEEGQS